MIYFILAYLVVIPLFYMLGVQLRPAQEFAFQTLGYLIIIASLFFPSKEIKRDKLNMSLAALFVWFWITYLINKNMGYSVMLNLFIGLGIYYTIIRTLKKEHIQLIFKVLLWMGCFSIVYFMFQRLGWDMRDQLVINTTRKTQTIAGIVPDCSIFGLAAAFGMYLTVLIPVMLSCSWLGLFLLVPLFFAKSTGAFLAAAVAMFFFWWFRKRIMFWCALIPVLIVLIGFVVLVDNPMGMQKSRFDMWGKVIQDSFKRPIGHGLDSFRTDEREGAIRYYKHSFDDTTIRVKRMENQWWAEKLVSQQFQDAKKKTNPLDLWEHPHNEYVSLFFEIGAIGLLVVGFIFYFIWQRFFKSKRSNETVALMACLVAFAVFSITQFPFHLARLAHLVPVLLGLFYVSTTD